MAIGTFILIASLFIASFTTKFIVFFFVWGFMFSFSLSLFVWIPLTILAEWFPNNKGLINGILWSINVTGAGLLPKLARSVIGLDPMTDPEVRKKLNPEELE